MTHHDYDDLPAFGIPSVEQAYEDATAGLPLGGAEGEAHFALETEEAWR